MEESVSRGSRVEEHVGDQRISRRRMIQSAEEW